MKTAQFQIIYDGPALESHEMDVYDLAPALMAMGGLVEEVGNSLYGDKFKIGVSVKGSFKTGCFGVEMVATAKHFIDSAVDIFNHGNTTAVLNAAGIIGIVKYSGGNLIGFLRWLKNRTVTKKIPLADDGIVRVFVDDDYYDIEQKALNLLQKQKIRQAFENIIAKPLSRDGINTLAFMDAQHSEDPILIIEKHEAVYFIAPDPGDEKINDQTTIVSLQIISPSFADGNKWRFTDGIQSFHAEIQDEVFLDRVNKSQEVFAKNDILKARVKLEQWLTSRGIKSEYFIVEVIEHRSAIRQIDLFPLPDNTEE